MLLFRRTVFLNHLQETAFGFAGLPLAIGMQVKRNQPEFSISVVATGTRPPSTRTPL